MTAPDASSAEVSLTPTERRLWDTLRGAPGRVFSRLELRERLMPGTRVGLRTIDVHIRGLRAKLGPRAACIKAVRGIGYRCGPG
jgi:DNA-binding response OmpR family regulator